MKKHFIQGELALIWAEHLGEEALCLNITQCEDGYFVEASNDLRTWAHPESGITNSIVAKGPSEDEAIETFKGEIRYTVINCSWPIYRASDFVFGSSEKDVSVDSLIEQKYQKTDIDRLNIAYLKARL